MKKGLADTEAEHMEVHIVVVGNFDMPLESLAADIDYTAEGSILGCQTVMQVPVQGPRMLEESGCTLEVLPTAHMLGLKGVDTQPVEDAGKMEPVLQVRGIAGTEVSGELWPSMTASLDSETRLADLATVHHEMNCHQALRCHLGSLDERLVMELAR